MSESNAARNEIPGTYSALARNSLSVVFVVLASSGCIVTGSPDISKGDTTKPELTVVEPALTELLCVPRQGNSYEAQTFSVLVASQDAADREVLTALLLRNYGFPLNPDQENSLPYEFVEDERDIPRGSLNDEPRLVSLSWTIGNTVQPGTCHSLTMLVRRERYGQPPYTECPVNDQFALVTWFAALEDEDGDCGPALATCPIAGSADQTKYCPPPEDLPTSDGGNP